jgi:hypothetical protein
MRKALSLRFLAPLLIAAAPLGADVWDTADDDNGTSNQLVHGSAQQHDLDAGAAADEDWYLLSTGAFASFEVLVEATAPEIQGSGVLSLVDSSGGIVANATVMGFANDGTRALRIENPTSDGGNDNFVRVTGACGVSCGPSAVYQIRSLETTAYVPRFNNSATQTTFLLLQNARQGQNTIGGNVHFFDAAGTLLATQPFALPSLGSLVLNTATVPGVAGQAGHARITHAGGYGAVAGKAVALEPATGFTFDTPVLTRPN